MNSNKLTYAMIAVAGAIIGATFASMYSKMQHLKEEKRRLNAEIGKLEFEHEQEVHARGYQQAWIDEANERADALSEDNDNLIEANNRAQARINCLSEENARLYECAEMQNNSRKIGFC